MFGNINPTAYDLRFSLLGVPVRVNPWFWLVAVLLGRQLHPRELVIWVAVVFVSIVIHEMGHALMIRSCGWRPSVVLYTFGGLAIYEPTYRNPAKQILISLAGPAAGFSFAALILALAKVTNHGVHFHLGLPRGVMADVSGIANENLDNLVYRLLEVNIGWGLINLLPVFPLDGGQALRELFYYLRVPDALTLSLWISVFAAAIIAAYAIGQMRDFYIGVMFGFLAFNSFQTLQAHQGRGGGYGGWS